MGPLHVSSPVPRGKPEGVPSVSPEVLLRWLASGRRVLVVDVREAEEIAKSRTRFPGALEIPAHELFVRRDELPLEQVDSVVAVSNTGERSQIAAYTLSLLGAKDARSLTGGLEAWAARGMPLA
jgi:rhodanese-related sulfurtransferase